MRRTKAQLSARLDQIIFGDGKQEQVRPLSVAGLPTYTVIRNGEFKCNLRELNQCGPAGTSVFAYRAIIEGTVLDGNKDTGGVDNFLIEHYAMADAIAARFGKGKWAASCEAFAGSIITMIHEMMNGRAERLHVAIKPGALAEIQIEWKRGQSLPTLLAVSLPKK